MGEMFHIEDTTITVNPTEPKLNRSLSRKSFNQEIEDTEEPPFIPPLLRSTSRRKSSIRFELGSLAKEVEDRESEDIMAQAQKRLSDMLMAIPAPVQISGSTEEISFSVPTLPSIQIEVPELKIAEPVTEDEPVTLIVPDLPSFQFQDMDDEYVLKEESISKESNASAGSSESTPDSEEAVEEDDQFDESESLSSSPTVGRKVYRQSDSVDVAPRRISIAVWTDQKLMKKVNKKKDELAKMPSILGKRAEVVMSPIQDEEETVPLSPNTQSRFDQRREAVFLSVCKHLNLQELGRLRQTCSRTSDLILESLPTSVKHMDLNAFRKQITDKSLAHVVKFYGYQIESLDLTACWQLTDKGLETLAKNCPSLTSLKLNEVWEISNYGIKMISRNCAQLKNIDLSNCKNLTNEGVHHLLANCSSLETISLSYCKALSSSLMDHENWSQIKKLNLHRCTGVADRGFELWTTLIEEEDMWAQSRSLAASREWLENDTEQLGELSRSENMGNTGDMNESFNAGSDEDEVMEREPNPESNEGLGLDSKDDGGQQLGGKDLGATLAVKDHSQSGKHSSMSLAEGSWSKITSFQDLAGGSSAATPNVLARLSQESLNQDRDPDNVREFSESSPTSASRLSLNQGGLGPMILIEDSQGEDVYESSSEIDERKTGFLLQSLTLRDCSFLTDSSIASLASVCGHLRLLNLSFCCSLTEEFARHLVKGCSKLVALDVSFCGGAVTDYTLLHLSTGLQKLKALSIRGCVQVSDVGIDHLHANSTRLSVLNVTQCKNISPELLLKLKRAWTLLDTESVCDYVERSPKLCTLDYSQPAHK